MHVHAAHAGAGSALSCPAACACQPRRAGKASTQSNLVGCYCTSASRRLDLFAGLRTLECMRSKWGTPRHCNPPALLGAQEQGPQQLGYEAADIAAVRRAHEERLAQALEQRLGELQALPASLAKVRAWGSCNTSTPNHCAHTPTAPVGRALRPSSPDTHFWEAVKLPRLSCTGTCMSRLCRRAVWPDGSGGVGA